ncbi:FtsK/SpoIIIE domain-containing protein [Streptomyces phytophilus]|uniref:FtsK/SpoIIIE domain-containing protein n=1 Tax=Streptomyces phytophilus TaxID=722715 RepID=UPI00286802EC|nr:FtsK/SpoIIIE domain-containing protein [Streptomyces phytophilus]
MTLEHTGTAAVVLAVAFFLAMATFSLVRYLRADAATRASLRQAARIRRSWRRLAFRLGLVVTDRMPTTTGALTTSPGKRPEPRVITPKITTRADPFGVRVRMRALPGVGLEEVTRCADHLANAWGCTRVSVLPDGPGFLHIRAVRHDPLLTRTAYRPDGVAPVGVASWPVGVDEYAEQVCLPLANVAGVTVAGLPGSGKTSLINALLCRLAPSPAVQFAVADGKSAEVVHGDYAATSPRLFAYAGDDLQAANTLFARLVKLMEHRMAVIKTARGSHNFWDLGPDASWPLTVLIIDEAHTYFRDHKGSDAATKRLATLAAQNIRLVEALARKGRAFGIMVILATQKATGDALPTSIRDVCALSLSFAQKTEDAAVAALGDSIRTWPDASPTRLQDPAYVGVASMALQGRPGFTRIRTPLVAFTDAARIAESCAHLTADPATLLPHPPGPTLAKAA